MLDILFEWFVYFVKYVNEYLPKKTRHSILRYLLEVRKNVPAEITFKAAETKEEWEAAFRLLHDTYVQSGTMTANQSGMRVSKYHALPTTVVFIALWRKRVVGTVSIIQDSFFGLPIEEKLDLSGCRKNKKIMVEIASLAVHGAVQDDKGLVLFPLIKIAFEYCSKYLGADYLVAEVTPDDFDFFEGVLSFSRIPDFLLKNHFRTSNSTVFGEIIDIKAAPMKYLNIYGGKPSGKNLYNYFFDNQEDILVNVSIKKYLKPWEFPMDPDTLGYFFKSETRLFEALTKKERLMLCSLYQRDECVKVISKFNGSDFKNERLNLRFPLYTIGVLRTFSDKEEKVIIQNVSSAGFKAYVGKEINMKDHYNCEITIGNKRRVVVEVIPVWKDVKGNYGFVMINEVPSEWSEFIVHLEMGFCVTKDERDTFTLELVA